MRTQKEIFEHLDDLNMKLAELEKQKLESYFPDAVSTLQISINNTRHRINEIEWVLGVDNNVS